MTRRRDERGAVAIIAGVISMVLIIVAAFAVDLGMQRVARRDMQSLADVVALDLVRELDGQRTVSQLTPLMPGLAQASLVRNQLCGPAASRQVCNVGGVPQVTVELGTLSPTGAFMPTTAAAVVPRAVRVTAATSVGFAFVPGSGGAVRTAVANTDSGACFKIGSVGAALDTKRSALLNAVLGQALGSPVSLSIASYQGLANASLSLLDLIGVPSLGVGTVDQLLTTEVSLAKLYTASAVVLRRQGDTAQAAVLDAFALAVGSAATVGVGTLINVDQGNGAAAAASLNALDLLYGAATVSNGQSFVEVPSLGINLPLASLTGSVRVGQAAKAGCGRVPTATATTQQVSANLNGSIASLPGVTAVGLTVSSTSVTITNLSVTAANATGTLTAATCGTPDVAKPDVMSVLATPGLVTITGNLSVRLGAQMQLPLGLLGAMVLVDLDIVIPATLNASSSAAGTTVNMQFPTLGSYSAAYPAGSAGVGLSPGAVTLSRSTTTVTATLLGIPLALGGSLATVLDAAMTITSSLTTQLNSALVLPLMATLGVRIASADVFGLPRPLCSEPALRG
ncbi:pilus assembly protein TadG-related protein [Nocardioides psychrotolerans]|uniref:Uncharacterized membrane protein n=1 Tax=Nocardioides psychrotolerans TaxID=1005945 RepID=A0A1I3CWR2_9ACTN|nr:pilus assembly protein TadG-related protein [Nocardioides psychrotolerans]SFH78857.1 Uncharacterized membrane protein [Nocardioides psychrotolerans]